MNLRQSVALKHPVGLNQQAPEILQDRGRINGIAWRTCLAIMPDPDLPGAWKWVAGAAHCNETFRPYSLEHYSRRMIERAGQICHDLLAGVGQGPITMTAAPSGVTAFRAMTIEEQADVAGRIIVTGAAT
jgi:hypothetical protein